MSQLVDFFWDVGSPYTYLASTQLAGLAQRTGADVRWRPFLLGGVFKATGNTMPAALAAKARYMLDDLSTWAAFYQVPFAFPAQLFPVNSLLPMRVCAAVDAPQQAAQLGAALMHAYWAAGRDPSDPAVIGELASGLGLKPAALLERAQTPEAKGRLRATTDEAVARGAFGAPTLFVGDKMFWGNDRLVLLERHLRASISS